MFKKCNCENCENCICIYCEFCDADSEFRNCQAIQFLLLMIPFCILGACVGSLF